MGELIDAAFENHLHFIGAHRGEVERGAEGIGVRGNAPYFTSWTPLDDGAAVPDRCPAVRLAPWCGAGWGERLAAQGFAAGETLAYMQLTDPAPAIPGGAAEVREGRGEEDAIAFATVQAAGFATGTAEVDDFWAGFFCDMAVRNIAHADQSFYLGSAEGETAGCALVVRAAGVAGIYAVATRPDYRGRGVSAAILERIRADSLERGCGAIILQAMKGSYAEHYYGGRGFETMRDLTVWRREGAAG